MNEREAAAEDPGGRYREAAQEALLGAFEKRFGRLDPKRLRSDGREGYKKALWKWLGEPRQANAVRNAESMPPDQLAARADNWLRMDVDFLLRKEGSNLAQLKATLEERYLRPPTRQRLGRGPSVPESRALKNQRSRNNVRASGESPAPGE